MRREENVEKRIEEGTEEEKRGVPCIFFSLLLSHSVLLFVLLSTEQSFASRFFKTIVESIPQRVPPRPIATQLQQADPWHIIWHNYEQ
jgi:hypothetical protein